MCFPYVWWCRKRMDSSTEEEDEQFFETLQDIASSSDGDSGTEEQNPTNVSQDAAKASVPVNLPYSRYEVWKRSPGSVLERRQRLFMLMGLKVDQEDSENSVVLVDTAPAGSFPDLSSSIPSKEHSGQNRGDAACSDNGVPRTTISGAPSASDGRTMVRSRSDGTFSRLQNNDNVEGYSLRLVRSGTTSPLLSHGRHERLVDSSGGPLRTGSGSNLPSKPPLGRKRENGKTAPSSAEGSLARKLQFQWSKFGRFRVTDKNGNSLFDSDAKVSGETRAPRSPLGDSGETVNSKDGEVLCRIKDLNSGREFVVNEVGKDGMWNKLKELDTGREITLEEFESTLGLSPIVQEVMRRERAAGDASTLGIPADSGAGSQKKEKGWFKTITGVVKGLREKSGSLQHGSGSDKEASTEKSSRKSGSATDDSQDSPKAARPVKVRVHKKSVKEFADLRLRQEIHAHQGAIWTMKFSLDGCYLATAGQDRVVKVWEVLVHNSRSSASPTSSGELNLSPDMLPGNTIAQGKSNSKRSSKSSSGRKDATSHLPSLFMLSGNAKCTFVGHKEDILDLSWSPSQYLLSSSMDKTVRLWNISSRSCLKIFTHNDYVTCIQFHPLEPGYFISGSLDGKVRIWSIQEPQVIDWVDLQEMVTAACYTPNGQGAVVGSYKGTCRFYKTPGNKLQLDTTFEVHSTKTRRSQGKKITGFQFVPGDKMRVLITSNDSRIRVYDGSEIISKYKGFRNSKSHISASFSRSGRFIICASEDSRVCIWNSDELSNSYSGTQRMMPGAYEDFSAKHVLVAIPWPGFSMQSPCSNSGDPQVDELSAISKRNDTIRGEELFFQKTESKDSSNAVAVGRPACPTNASRLIPSLSDLQDAEVAESVANPPKFDTVSKPLRPDSYRDSCCGSSLLSNCVSAQQIGSTGFFSDCKGSATWPEEKLPSLKPDSSSHGPFSMSSKDAELVNLTSKASAWGLVIVTGGLGGEIRVFQNYSLPVRI